MKDKSKQKRGPMKDEYGQFVRSLITQPPSAAS